MGESRQELLGWLNDLHQLKVTKDQQCGTGAALCQIYDSIYEDLPLSRVNFNVNTEYAYLQNFQNCFAKHQVDRLPPPSKHSSMQDARQPRYCLLPSSELSVALQVLAPVFLLRDWQMALGLRLLHLPQEEEASAAR